MSSSYRPFPITEFKTGFYQYLEPWIRPQDAFEPLEDAFIYRGTLNKRPGYRPLGNTTAAGRGRMFYKDYSDHGDGATATYSFTISTAPIIPGTLVVTAGAKTATDNGLGQFIGDVSAPPSGSINYSTGAVTVVFDAVISSTVPIYSQYALSVNDYLSLGNGTVGPYSITTKTNPVSPGTLVIYAGNQVVRDDGSGNLEGDGSGTIDYGTGAISVSFTSAVSSSTWIYVFYNSGFGRPIMGLKTWVSGANGSVKLVAFDTRRACVFDDNTELFLPLNEGALNTITIPANPTGAPVVTNLTVNTGFTNLVPYTLSMTDGTSTVTDTPGVLPAGSFGTSGNFTPASTVDYSTGIISLAYTTPATTEQKTIVLSFTIGGDYFTGDYTNFFNAINWKPTTVSYLYCTNNIDRITLFDGTKLSRPPFFTNSADRATYTNNIAYCIDLDVFKNRLLLHRPTLVGGGNPEFQTIRFSAQFNPTNLVADVVGNGGALVFPTQDQIMVGEFLRDQMIVFMKNSAWVMQPTGFANPPFRAIQVNGTRSTNCPYGAVPYDQRITSIGSKGIIACDGVNTQRFDVGIIDQFLEINPQAYNQCFSQRYDAINQTWTLYPELGHTQSNKILVYNFLENTWATYSIPMSCLGLYQVISDASWSSFAEGGPNPKTWEQAQFNWKYYLNQKGSAQLLAGGQEGTVFVINDENAITDNGAHYDCDIISTLWNPFVKEGVAVDFGYIDFYYEVDEQVTLLLTFYINGENDVATQHTLTLNPSNVATSQLTNFERVYLNFRAQFVQMEISVDPSSNGLFQINGLVLWAKPAGRMQPGYNLI